MKHPKLIHRVWLGLNTPPPEHDYATRWAETNPGWELITWTDQLVAERLELVCGAEYEAAPTYVHRADIILVEAVWALGGVSVGYDMEPLRPIDRLIGGHRCWCTPDADGFPGQAFFGATPHHPAMGAVLEALPGRIAERGWSQPHLDTGPYLWGDVFGRFGHLARRHGLSILGNWRTAYPIRYWEKHLFDDPAAYAQRTRQSYVVHRFAHSWANPEDVAVR